jgi:hypothetical protein
LRILVALEAVAAEDGTAFDRPERDFARIAAFAARRLEHLGPRTVPSAETTPFPGLILSERLGAAFESSGSFALVGFEHVCWDRVN